MVPVKELKFTKLLLGKNNTKRRYDRSKVDELHIAVLVVSVGTMPISEILNNIETIVEKTLQVEPFALLYCVNTHSSFLSLSSMIKLGTTKWIY